MKLIGLCTAVLLFALQAAAKLTNLAPSGDVGENSCDFICCDPKHCH
jgi:hypothetical protein